MNASAVDVLLGLDAATFMTPWEVTCGSTSELCAERTSLGWVVAGPNAANNGSKHHVLRTHVSSADEDTSQELRKFWEVDSFGVQVESAPPYTHAEQAAMDVLKKTCYPEDSGYEVGLLWKIDRPPLPDNYSTALKCLQSVECWLQQNPQLVEGYCKAINAYVDKGFTRKFSLEECVKDGEQCLLPHHPVVSPHKPLPRIVFDSAAQHEGICLNDCLETGPSLHNDLAEILLHLHEKPVALTGDVADMFCHVWLCLEDICGVIWTQHDPQTHIK